MQATTFHATARQWISGFDSGAQRAIAGWRAGGDRLGQAARARWDRAFAESSPQLSPETRRNASHFRDVVARRYARGVELSATGAERAVTALVQAAQAAVDGRMPR
ncbi:MAG TPA: hypothetical protein VGD76_10655 [Ramlibacter sp.]